MRAPRGKSAKRLTNYQTNEEKSKHFLFSNNGKRITHYWQPKCTTFYNLVRDSAFGGWEEYPAARHGNAGTLGFVDGHVEMKRWVDPRTLIPVTGSIWHPVVNQFGSPDYHYVCLRSHKLQPLYPFSDDF